MVLSPLRSGADRTALWCVPVADLAGVARHVLDAVQAGIPGWRIIVLCPEGALAERLHELNAPVLTGPVAPADGAASATRAIRRTLRRLRPDLLHTHLAFADLAGIAAVAGLRAGSGRRIRVVTTEHGISGVRGYYQSSPAKARLRAAAHRARLLRTDRVIAVSESTAQQISEQWGSGAKVSVIRNGVNRPENAPVPQPGLRILSLSRLAPEKRIDQLIRAFALVAAEHPKASMTIAGEGPEEHALKRLAGSLGLEARVQFPGHVDPAQALAEHDVVAQLSVWENLSYTLLDAVAYGLGVVATDVGGNREIVPERCLVDVDDLAGTARVIVDQGRDLRVRPADETVQNPAGMCAAVADAYEEATA